MHKSLSLFAFLLATTFAVAAPVSREAAEQQARDFLAQRTPQNARRNIRAAKNTLALKPVSTQSYYYVFNVGDQNGFVIVSGDDRTDAILGYADAGTFDEQKLPDNLKAWLQGYADELRWLDQHPQFDNAAAPQQAPRKVVAKGIVKPLLTTKWNQYAPYNNLCPLFFSTSQRCLTGCVATAMAQLMYYHQWPLQPTKDIEAYDCETSWSGLGKIHVNDIPATATFDWNNMLPTYGTSATDQQNTAVAQLMQVCGAAVKMNYGTGSSSAYDSNVVPALTDYFDYSATTQHVSRSKYTYDAWTDLLYGELAEARPFFYSGQSSGGGHAFVVDGYDGEGYFHVNWGWGGLHDGYYLLSVLNPGGSEGAGASQSNDGYSFGQVAVIGIQKNGGEFPPEPEAPKAPTYGSIQSVTLNGTTATVKCMHQNAMSETLDLDFGIGYVDADDNYVCLTYYWYSGVPHTWGASPEFTITGLPDGEYRLVPVSRIHDTTTWYSYLDPNEEYIHCVVSGGVVTELEHVKPAPKLSIAAVSCSEPRYAGSPLTVEATVKNTGNQEFYGKLYLFASQTATKGAAVAYGGVTVQEAKTVKTAFEFTPSAAGNYNLWIATDEDGNQVIGTSSVLVDNAPAVETTDNIDLAFSRVISSLSDDGTKILDTTAKVTWTITNSSDKNYHGTFHFLRYEFIGGGWKGLYYSPTLTVPAHGSTAYTCTFGDITTGLAYAFDVEYIRNGNITELRPYYNTRYTAAPGYAYYLVDGSQHYAEAAAYISVPATATAVDLREAPNVSAVSGGNPNTLYFIATSAIAPAGTSGNIVQDGEASNLVITDGYDFATPFDFTAKAASYDRTFATGLDRNGNGWSTITLPFNVNNVTVTFNANDYPIDWFHNGTDTGKNFWLMAFTHEDEHIVYFSHADELRAGQPYIIAMPGNEWGSGADLTGLPIHFLGTNVPITSDFKAATMGDDFKMKGTVASTDVTDAYVLNAEGNHFMLGNATVDAFRAYFASTALPLGSSKAYRIQLEELPTAIQSIRQTDANIGSSNAWFTLDGLRIEKPVQRGVYIHNGRKVVIK